jgi:hypothetical protein
LPGEEKLRTRLQWQRPDRLATTGKDRRKAVFSFAGAPALLDQSGDPISTGAGTRRAFDPKSDELPL